MPQEYWWQAYEDRLSVRRDAYIESGFIVNRNLICRPIRKKKYASQAEIGYLSFKKLIKNKIKFDTIFPTNDFLAMGCYQTVNELNINIPKDISIVGYDNTEIAANLKPGLTSVHLPILEMTKKLFIIYLMIKTMMKTLKFM